jgi:hypothetical protein
MRKSANRHKSAPLEPAIVDTIGQAVQPGTPHHDGVAPTERAVPTPTHDRETVGYPVGDQVVTDGSETGKNHDRLQ